MKFSELKITIIKYEIITKKCKHLTILHFRTCLYFWRNSRLKIRINEFVAMIATLLLIMLTIFVIMRFVIFLFITLHKNITNLNVIFNNKTVAIPLCYINIYTYTYKFLFSYSMRIN